MNLFVTLSFQRPARRLGDIHRFNHPRQLMTYLGLVSTEHSSGPRQHLATNAQQNHPCRCEVLERHKSRHE